MKTYTVKYDKMATDWLNMGLWHHTIQIP